MKKILTHKKQIKIHFLIKKQVEYGSGVYVSGSCNELGAWNIEHALRLNWNPDHYWSGFIWLTIRQQFSLQFKYIVANYDCPNNGSIQWQQGQFNRQITITRQQDHVLIQNVWNTNQICLNLLVPKYIIYSQTQIYLAGGCNQLGNWKSRLKLNKIQMSNLSQTQIIKAKQNIIIQDYYVYQIIALVQRNLKSFNYYFIKQTSSQLIPDRVPQRQFKIHLAQNQNHTCLHISNKAGNYQILELSKIVQLHYSQITHNMFIGGRIQMVKDVKELKKRGITNIVCITTSQLCNELTVNLIRLVSQSHKIQYSSINLNLYELDTLIEQSKQALSLLDTLLQSEDNIIYLYSDQNVFLPPLLAALYLSIYKGIYLRKALEFIKQRYYFSEVDQNVMGIINDIAEDGYFQRSQFQLNTNKIRKRLQPIVKN